jgi:hypothetical protein
MVRRLEQLLYPGKEEAPAVAITDAMIRGQGRRDYGPQDELPA